MYTRDLAIQAYELSPYSPLGKAGMLLLTQFNNIDRAIEAAKDEKVATILLTIKAQEKAGAKNMVEKI